MAQFALITDDPGWHGARLKRAFAARGHSAVYLSLTACHFDLERADAALPVQLPGFAERLPAGVFVRGVPGGSLEQVTFYLDILHALALLGVKVYNDARSIERTVDKGMTSFLLRRAGIPTPPTWVVAQRDQAHAILERELHAGHQLVYKPLFGSQGMGLQRLTQLDDSQYLPEAGIYYLQRFVHCGASYHDWRVFVIRGRAVAAMRRLGQTWLNNVAQGGRCETADLDSDIAHLAVSAVAAVGMDYAGVDLMRAADGTLSVIEINSVPAWKGLQSVSAVNLADCLVDDLIDHCQPVNG